jgi:hypothetical protein
MGVPSAEVKCEEMAIMGISACCMLVFVLWEFAEVYKAVKRCRHF